MVVAENSDIFHLLDDSHKRGVFLLVEYGGSSIEYYILARMQCFEIYTFQHFVCTSNYKPRERLQLCT